MNGLIVFSRTQGYRHESIEACVEAVQELAGVNGVNCVLTEDPDVFSEEVLAEVTAVVWAHTSGTGLLNSAQRTAYETFTGHGGGFAAIHAASDGERDWPLYDQLIGARFRSHPAEPQEAVVRVRDREDPSTAMLPEQWRWHDEWYTFDRRPGGGAEVLLTVDERTYDVGDVSMGADHPVSWRLQVGAARSWYTALGHESSAYADERFRAHLWSGINSVREANRTGE